MLCKNCKEQIALCGNAVRWWTHVASLSWRCRDDSGNHAEPEEN